MKPLVTFVMLVCVLNGVLAADTTATNDTNAIQQEQVFQRFLKEMRKLRSEAPTHVDFSCVDYFDTTNFREMFLNQMVVDPSFGYRWDEVPAPTMTGTNAMDAVHSFIATNGWDMQ